MQQVVSNVIPIVVLIGLGVVVRRTHLLDRNAIDGVKTLVMNLGLPAVLFLAFLNIHLRLEFLYLVLAVIAMLVVFFAVGAFAQRLLRPGEPLLPFFGTGFAFGFLGIPLFAIVFGEENLGIFSVMGVGHELFVWFLYYPLIMLHYDREGFSARSLLNILRSPLIIAIIVGLAANAVGLREFLNGNFFFAGLMESARFLAATTTPLILIVIGYGLSLDWKAVRVGTAFTLARFALVFGIGYTFKVLVLDRIVTSDPVLFGHAVFTFLVLPPLFSLPIFVGSYGDRKGEELANAVVTVGTVVSILAFLAYAVAVP